MAAAGDGAAGRSLEASASDGSASSSKASCTVLKALAACWRATNTEILISLVVIIRMLMPFSASDRNMGQCIEQRHDDGGAHRDNRETDQCPCALRSLIVRAVEAIGAVDERRADLR